MIYPSVQFALREWRRQMSHRLTLPVLAGTATLLALSGAFGTDQHLRLVPRLLYWGVLIVMTYSVGLLCSSVLEHLARDRLSAFMRILLAGAMTGLGVTACVITLNLGFFAFLPRGAEFFRFFGTVMVISVVVTAIIELITREIGQRPPAVPPTTSPPEKSPESPSTAPDQPQAQSSASFPAAEPLPDLPPILERLPLDKRGPLVRLSVEDHYVRITTQRGEEMVLMRLADAIREVGTTPGLQVHRSHWVALSAITAARRDKDRAILTLCSGDDIPVSRANIPKIKEAGLLPR